MMMASVWTLFLVAAFPAPPAEVLSGTWWVKGHETYGSLVIRVEADGTVRGTIYDQPLEGKFDTKSRRLTFTRLRGTDRQGVQEWTGQLSHVEGTRPPRFTLEGTFRSIAGDEFGQAGVEYRWSSTEVRHPAPAVDLQEMQGNWEVAGVIRCLQKEVKLPDETGLNELAAHLQIRDNQLLFQGQVVATLANDLGLKALEKQVGFRGYRPICLTLRNGQGLMCSYVILSEGIEIAYPHTTSCHRGSGHVIMLKRPK